MNLAVAGLIAGLAANVVALLGLWLRLRWKSAQQQGHRQHTVELAQVLPPHSWVDTRHGSNGLRTQLSIGSEREHRDDGRV